MCTLCTPVLHVLYMYSYYTSMYFTSSRTLRTYFRCILLYSMYSAEGECTLMYLGAPKRSTHRPIDSRMPPFSGRPAAAPHLTPPRPGFALLASHVSSISSRSRLAHLDLTALPSLRTARLVRMPHAPSIIVASLLGGNLDFVPKEGIFLSFIPGLRAAGVVTTLARSPHTRRVQKITREKSEEEFPTKNPSPYPDKSWCHGVKRSAKGFRFR